MILICEGSCIISSYYSLYKKKITDKRLPVETLHECYFFLIAVPLSQNIFAFSLSESVCFIGGNNSQQNNEEGREKKITMFKKNAFFYRS